jgi:nicotinate phosphoribosyltransferase
MLTFTVSGSYTDLYEITMGQTYYLEGRTEDTACFDYFFRKLPNESGYVLFAGLEELLSILGDLHFTKDDLDFLTTLHLDPAFLDYLKRFAFRGNVYSVREGEIVFPNCPILRVESNIIEAQLIESLVLNVLNFQSLVATKASRMRSVAGNRSLSDFGLRRAQGLGALMAARAAIVGGFNTTSNVYAARLYGVTAVGTMAHSFVESYDEEIEAFRAFARSRPDDCTFLVDTYDTLKSGVPHAITVAKEMEHAGHRAKAIRLDSGDLAYLARAARMQLDEVGLQYIKIVASNQLDEYVIKSLLEQQAPIDIFGVGTRLVTGKPDAALDGVYKLSMASDKPRLKLSEDPKKIILPGIKQVLRVMDEQGKFYGADAILLSSEGENIDTMYHLFERDQSIKISDYKKQPLLHKVMAEGKRLSPTISLTSIAQYAQSQLALLPAEFKRFENPHLYKVGISRALMELREQLKGKHQFGKDATKTLT